MALKITNSETNGTSVVTLDGRIVLGEEGNALREKLKNLIAGGKKQIVVNMELITSVDSSGLGTLFAAHLSAKAEGASLKLCNVGCKKTSLLLANCAAGTANQLHHSSRHSAFAKSIRSISSG
jgi:anti-anti-sigma factor